MHGQRFHRFDALGAARRLRPLATAMSGRAGVGTVDKIAICAIFKDEAPYLLEWLAFHKMIGVDFFFLYNNGSDDGGADLIRRSSFARNVTLIDWPDRPGQLAAYNHFRVNHARRFTWAAFIDIDEFIMPVAGSSIRDILVRKVYQPYAAILLQWLVFGPSGHNRRPEGLVIENYTRRLPQTDAASCHVKRVLSASCLRRRASTTARSNSIFMRGAKIASPASIAYWQSRN